MERLIMKRYALNYSSLLLVGLATCNTNVHAYESTYERIQWDKRGNDTYYCIDITGVNYEIHPWLQALTCGENLYSFSPKDYLSQTMKRSDLATGTKFGWRVWSNSGYGGSGYEGVVTLGGGCVGQAYTSSNSTLQWGCRNNDTFYCVDILDSQGAAFVKQAAACNEGLHSFSPTSLNLSSGNYTWKIWSNSGYGGEGFSGSFTVGQGCSGLSYASSSSALQWGCRNNDTYYCVDILNSQGAFVKQAAACSEGLHSFSPTSLNLSAGNYAWKIWSNSGYGGSGFDGTFTVGQGCSGLSYASSSSALQWGCRNNDTYYCVDILDSQGAAFVKQAATCSEGLHSFSPTSLNLSSGNYTWKIWSNSGYGGSGFDGTFTVDAPVVTTPIDTTPITTTSTGKTLYNQYCVSCHGGVGNVRGATNASTIRSAISSNKGGMGMLNFLTNQQLSDIAAYAQNPN
jgi:hypothetical protein